MPPKQLSSLFRNWVHGVRRANKRPLSKAAKLRLLQCEDRLAPAVLPQPFITNNAAGVTFTHFGTAAPTPPAIQHSVQVAVDPNNANRQVAVGVSGNGLVGIFTVDGGQTWSDFLDTANTVSNKEGFRSRFRDPTTVENTISEATRLDAASPSVAWGRDGNVHVVHVQRSAGVDVNGTSLGPGYVVHNAYDFTNVRHIENMPGGGAAQKIYTWGSSGDAAFNPVVAVNNNIRITDPISGVVRDDITAGRGVYVSWNIHSESKQEGGSFNKDVVFVSVLANTAGQTFTTPVRVTPGFSSSIPSQAAAPQITFAPPQPLAAGVAQPSQLNIFSNQVAAPVIAVDQSTPAVIGPSNLPAVSVVVDGETGPIQNGAAADKQATTTFKADVQLSTNPLLTAATFVTDLNVRLVITDPNVDQLRLRLRNPSFLGSQTTVELLANRIDNAGAVRANNANGLTPGLPGGKNLGVQDMVNVQAGLHFDDQASRAINDNKNAAPYIGHFRLENGADTLRSLLSDTVLGIPIPRTLAALSGMWELEAFDSRGDTAAVVQRVDDFELLFTFGLPDGLAINDNPIISDASPRGYADVFGTASAKLSTIGIGGYSAAVDYSQPTRLAGGAPLNTLPTGSTYIAYATAAGNVNLSRIAENGTSLVTLPDGKTFRQVNDDKLADNFTEGDGVQFLPAVAVDSQTGTVAISWFDSRYDASGSRLANYITTSIDGGQTFSSQTANYVSTDASTPQDVSQRPYFNVPKTAADAITGTFFTIEPVPSNMTVAGVPQGFGTRQNLFFDNGELSAYWLGNQNAAGTQLLRGTAKTAVGPRVVDNDPAGMSDQGVILRTATVGGFSYNGVLADGTPFISGFKVVFDRPIDPSTFKAGDIVLTFRAPDGSTAVIPVLDPMATTAANTTFIVPLMAPQSKVGTYSYTIDENIRDSVTRYSPTNVYHADYPQTPQPILDNSTITSSITVPGGQTITDLNVGIKLTHTFIGDLTITLIAPNGVRRILFDQRDGSANNLLPITFDDSATRYERDAAGAVIDPLNSVPRPISDLDLTNNAGALVFTAPYTGSYRPEQTLSVFNGLSTGGVWRLEVTDNANIDEGILLDWYLEVTASGPLTQQARVGNVIDQNSNGIAGEAFDTFSIPRVNGTVADRVPLSIPGPFFTRASVPGTPAGSAPHGQGDSLYLNSGANAINVTFDRDITPGSFTAASVLRMTGPYGPVAGPFTVTQLTTRVFQIGFPAQIVDGPYSLEFSPSTITSVVGTVGLDQNQNAAVSLTLGSDPLSNTIKTANYVSVPGAVSIPANGTASIALNVNDVFQIFQNPAISDLRIQTLVNITHPNVPDLQADLVAPDGTRIRLFTNVGTVGQPPRSNFNNATFQDNGTTPIQLGAAPFDLGTFIPQLPLGTLVNRPANGQWRLEVTNTGNTTGTINSFQLNLPFAVTGSGVAEPVGDRFQVGFRLFTQDPTNKTTQTQWTPVGPATIFFNGMSHEGRLSAVTVDPSDPSGNTVYVAGASGGVWKTTNFLTLDAVGPVWIPLTDFGPTTSLNIGSIAVFPRNNDPTQSIVFALTGEGGGTNAPGTGTPGIGVLRSMDGGRTWKVLDGLVNADSTGTILPIADGRRDRTFVGTTGFRIIVDPNLSPTGEVVVYMAMSGTNGGIYRSSNTGRSWSLIRAGNASDVILAAGSIPRSGQSKNAEILYGAFQGEGVYIATQAPSAASMSLMTGGLGNPNIRSIDPATGKDVEVTVNAPGANPNGGKGRIVLTAPVFESTDLENSFYQGWLYALVATPAGSTDGLYVTKDFGRNWTRVNIPNVTFPPSKVGFPTNDESRAAVDYFQVLPGAGGQGNYDIAMTVSPNDPYIVYIAGVGGQGPAQTGSIRVDLHTLADAQALHYFDNSDPNAAGVVQNATVTGGALPRNPANTAGLDAINGPTFFNLSRDPDAPFLVNSTVLVDNTTKFVNDGADIKWVKFTGALGDTNDVHQVVSFIDPITRKARLIYIGDQAIGTGVDRGDGTIQNSIGFTPFAAANRNGNLQVNQQYSGAAQPSTLAADIAGAMFYAGTQDNGSPRSSGDVLQTGNIFWFGPAGDTSGVATDQTGSGTAYAYQWPCCGPALGSDFFRVDFPTSDDGFGVGRTFGLLRQGIDDPGADKGQWPLINASIGYPAINPIDKNGALLSSLEGRLYRSTTLADPSVGPNWFDISGFGSAGSLEQGVISKAQAFGAPDPANPGQINNFLYSGNNRGNIYVSNTGGSPWTNISAGLHPGQMFGPAVQDIEANPRRGSRDAFAVTTNGVFYNPDSLATGSTWQNITGNLFSLQKPIFGDATDMTTTLQSLSSLAVDWRFAIPDDLGNPSGPTHPVLYVGGDGGIYRSRDKGLTWSYFPNIAEDGAAVDGGYLPNVQITDLDISLGNIDPATGLPNQGLGGLNLLLASTYGRGQFAIRLNTTIDQPFNVQFESGPFVTRLANPNAVGGPSTQLRVVFDQSVDPTTVGVNDITLLDTNNTKIAITSVQLVSVPPGPGQSNPFNEFLVTFPSQSVAGFYSLTVGPTISDFAGNLMNQNQNGLNGEPTEDSFQRFVFLNGLANNLIVDGLPSKVVAGNATNFTVSVQDKDGFNITGFTGEVSFTSSDLGVKTVLPAKYTFAAADKGMKAFSVTFTTSNVLLPQTITATATTPGVVNPGRDGTIVLSAPASQLVVGGHTTPTVAGTDNSFQVMAKDQFGNLASDYTGMVMFASSDKQAVLPTTYKFQATDLGTKSFTAQLRTAGSQSISATDTVNVALNGIQTGIVVTPAAPAMLAILGLPDPYNAGDFKTITVQSQDKFQNVTPGYTGTVAFTSSDKFAALPGDYLFTAGDKGSKDFTVQLRIPGSQTVTATDTAATIKAATATTLVTPAAVASFKVQGHPSPVVAGTTNSFTVTAIAPDGTTAVGYLGDVTFTSTDKQAGLPAIYTFTVGDNGVHGFDAVLKTANKQAITATEKGSSITGTQSNIVVLPAAANSFRVASFPSPITAGVDGTFVVTALDAFQNTATGYTGTVAFTSSDSQASLPGNATFVSGNNGTLSFAATLKTAGNNQSITATDINTGSITGSQTGIVVNPAAASRYELKGHPTTVNAGDSATFMVIARDPFENIATGYTGIVTFTSSDKQASLPSNFQFKASDNGMRTFADTLRTSGLQSIIGTDTADASITGQQTGINVVAGAAVGITVDSFPPTTTAGVPQTFVVTARDQFQNAAPTYAGTVRLTSTDKQAALPANYQFTGGDGGAKIFTGTLKTAGLQSISVQDINTAAFNSTQSGITVVAATGTKLSLSSLPLSVMAGSNQQLLATVKDEFDNVATGYTGTLAFSSTDGQAALPANFTFASTDKGQKLFNLSLRTAGSQDFAVNDTANNTVGAGQNGIQVFAAAASKFDVTGLPTSVLSGDPATFAVAARDPFNNHVTNYTGIVTFASSDSRAQLPTNVAFAPGDNGVKSFSVRFGNPNVTSSVIVSDVSNAAVTGTASTNVLPNFDKGATLVGNEQFAVGTEARSGFPVRYFDSKGGFLFDTFPFQSEDVNGGGRVATADFTGDGRAEVVAGSSPGMVTQITVIDGFTERQLFTTQPFESAFTGGLYITGGDITGDGIPELIISPDEGGGPRVRVLDGADFNRVVVDFFGIDDPNFRGGARTAVGDINGDGFGDLLVAAGFGGGPRVAGYDGKALAAGRFVKIFNDFFAFEQSLRNGVFIAAGDLDGDGKAEMIIGGGPGGGPRVQAFSGASLVIDQQNPIVNFFAGSQDNRGGIRVAVKDLDGDKQADLITGAGTGAGSRLTAYFGKTLVGNPAPPVAFEFDTFPGFAGGVFVG